MKSKILLNYNENTRKIEDEEKTRFLKSILEQMGVPVQEFWTSDDPLSIDQRMQLRGILAAYEVQVIDNLDGMLQIYVSDDLVAEMKKPAYVARMDMRQVDPRKRPYMEMMISTWSLFEDAEQEGSNV
jgi:hypothetical protein